MDNEMFNGIIPFVNPKQWPYPNKIQSINILIRRYNERDLYKNYPSHEDIIERLNNLCIEVINYYSREHELFREICDICIRHDILIPTLEGDEEIQRILNENRLNENRLNENRLNETHLNKPQKLSEIANDKQNVHNSFVNNNVKEIVKHLVADYPTISDEQYNAFILKMRDDDLKLHQIKLKLDDLKKSTQLEEYNKLKSEYDQQCLKCKQQKREYEVKTQKHQINLMSKKLKFDNLWNIKHEKSIKFINTSTAQFGIGITLNQMLASLVMWIHEQVHINELYKRLSDELIDMYGMCSTGHMARIVNVLQGYTDNDKYILGIDMKSEIKKIVNKTLTNSLKNADENIVDGIIERTNDYIEYINKIVDENIKEWKEEFGEEYDEYIKECVEHFTN